MTLSLLFGDVSGLAAVLVDQGAPLLKPQDFRTIESKVDQMAVDLLIKNDIDPLGLKSKKRPLPKRQRPIETCV